MLTFIVRLEALFLSLKLVSFIDAEDTFFAKYKLVFSSNKNPNLPSIQKAPSTIWVFTLQCCSARRVQSTTDGGICSNLKEGKQYTGVVQIIGGY